MKIKLPAPRNLKEEAYLIMQKRHKWEAFFTILPRQVEGYVCFLETISRKLLDVRVNTNAFGHQRLVHVYKYGPPHLCLTANDEPDQMPGATSAATPAAVRANASAQLSSMGGVLSASGGGPCGWAGGGGGGHYQSGGQTGGVAVQGGPCPPPGGLGQGIPQQGQNVPGTAVPRGRYPSP